MNLIILGAPGAGKGTQAQFISDRYSIPVIGTGNLIREAMKNGTELGKEVKGYMESGGLVPDELVIKLLKEHIEEFGDDSGFVLDGFPRTVAQAQELDDMGVRIDKVISLEVDDDVIIKRLSGRKICGKCGSSYHMEDIKPKVTDKCDRCGGDLIVRDDDKPEIIAERFKIYHKETAPVKDYYAKSGKLHLVESKKSVDETTAQTISILEE